MTRQRLPYLQKETTRHGKTSWYFRKGDGPRIRIRGEYGSDEFTAAYDAAVNQRVVPAPQKRPLDAPDTLAGLIRAYRQSAAWTKLSETTRKQRDNIFHRMVNSEAGSLPYASITQSDILNGQDKRKETRFAANNWLKAMRGLFKWATDRKLITINPTLGVTLMDSKTMGFHAWSEEEASKFEARWPIGTRERLAFAILLFTGMRRGDAYRLGKQHVRNGVIYMRTEKKGVEIEIPVHPELQRIIDATPMTGLTFVAKANGHTLDKFSFGNFFKDACKAAGVPGSAHGLRKLCAIRWAHAGATVQEMMAWFGWMDPKMATLYCRNANRGRLSQNMFDRAGIPASAAS